MNGEMREKLDYILKRIKRAAEIEDATECFINRTELLKLTLELIPANIAAWAESTPTGVVSLHIYPEDTVLELDYLKDHIHESFLHDYRCRNPWDRSSSRLSDCLKSAGYGWLRDLKKSPLHKAVFNEYYLPNDILFQIDVITISSSGMFHPICLYRCKGGDFEYDFSEDDRKCLNEINECLDEAFKSIAMRKKLHMHSVQPLNQVLLETDRDGNILKLNESEIIDHLLKKYFGFGEKTHVHGKLPKPMWNRFTVKKRHFSCMERAAFPPKRTKYTGYMEYKDIWLVVYAYFTHGQEKISFILQEACCLPKDEYVIAGYVVQGGSHRYIAKKLNKSPNTVRNQIRSIYSKVDLRSEGRGIEQTAKLASKFASLYNSRSIVLLEKNPELDILSQMP
jgi:hypothetical protein